MFRGKEVAVLCVEVVCSFLIAKCFAIMSAQPTDSNNSVHIQFVFIQPLYKNM